MNRNRGKTWLRKRGSTTRYSSSSPHLALSHMQPILSTRKKIIKCLSCLTNRSKHVKIRTKFANKNSSVYTNRSSKKLGKTRHLPPWMSDLRRDISNNKRAAENRERLSQQWEQKIQILPFIRREMISTKYCQIESKLDLCYQKGNM